MKPSFSVRVASVLGIPVRLHLVLPVLFLYMLFTTKGWTRPEVFLPLLVYFAVIVVMTLAHELGHCLVARHEGGRARSILLWPLGGLAHVEHPSRPDSHMRVALAGVGVNLVVAVIAGGLLWLRDGSPPGLPSLAVPASIDVLAMVWHLNAVLGLLNLAPGLPWDGGRALEGLLWTRIGRASARRVALVSGALIGVAVLLAGIIWHPLLIVLGAWALHRCAVEYMETREPEMPEDEPLFGVYDFSDGYRGLGEEQTVTRPRPRTGRRERRPAVPEPDVAVEVEEPPVQTERQRRAAARERLDSLLDRIAQDGLESLSAEDRAFLDEESARLRRSRRDG